MSQPGLCAAGGTGGPDVPGVLPSRHDRAEGIRPARAVHSHQSTPQARSRFGACAPPALGLLSRGRPLASTPPRQALTGHTEGISMCPGNQQVVQHQRSHRIHRQTRPRLPSPHRTQPLPRPHPHHRSRRGLLHRTADRPVYSSRTGSVPDPPNTTRASPPRTSSPSTPTNTASTNTAPGCWTTPSPSESVEFRPHLLAAGWESASWSPHRTNGAGRHMPGSGCTTHT